MISLFKRWVWLMALRDARRGLKTMLLSMSCVVLGVSAVVASYSFRDNLQSSVRAQSKGLLGADLAIASREPFSNEAEALIASIGGNQSRQIGFSSMAYFPKTGNSRLVQVRAIGVNFPYYGALETDPPAAINTFHGGLNALVDETLMLQFDARIGDRLKVGDQEFRIAGKLRKIPGETLAFSLLSPRVYVPIAQLDQAVLNQKGGRVRYRAYFKLDSRVDVDGLVARISPELARLRLRADTVARRMNAVSRSMENLSRYLRLAVFTAVLLAGVGVGSGTHVYAKQKTFSVATLRCLGARPRETVFIYVIQALLIALAGSVLGAALGTVIQASLPIALKDFLPVSSVAPFSMKGVFAGISIGLGTSLLFALIPLVSLRRISPLVALRSSYEPDERLKDPFHWLIFLSIVAAIFAFALATTENWVHALWFTGGVLTAFGSIALVARGISILMKKLIPGFLPFAWRQGLANLYRPNNQTMAVMLAIGLGTFLMVTLFSVHSMLVNQVVERSGKGEPNLVLFDVQKDQREAIANLFSSFSVSAYEEVPIVTLRLAAVKNRRVEEIRADANPPIPGWALRREYRSTYRSRLASTEQIIMGEWQGRVAAGAQPIPVSLERSIAETLKVSIGDPLQFELQGVPLITEVASVREVDWQRVQPNFFVVFPEGVLESAPQFFAIATRAEPPQVSASLQRAVVERFPNVSMIDLTLVLNTLDSILDRVSAALHFIALFVIITGVAVLFSAVLSSRPQRLKESILMRTLGAPRLGIIDAIVAEYLLLGLISCVTGALLATVASWGLSYYFLSAVPRISWTPVVAIVVMVTGGTVLAGLAGCWGIFRRPALEALRAET
ncbi:MAG: ABC transporter permease [Candidatus Binatia bacterium]